LEVRIRILEVLGMRIPNVLVLMIIKVVLVMRILGKGDSRIMVLLNHFLGLRIAKVRKVRA
jgi:hypothetical protein